MIKNNLFKNRNAINSIMRWILFGVFIVVAPPLFNVWFKIIVGFNIDCFDCIPDVLMALLAVCCNLINTCVDGEKKINYLLRWLLCILLGIISLGCWGFFFVIRFVPKALIEEYIYNDILIKLICFASGVIISCCVIGIIIELYTSLKSNTIKKSYGNST